ncbi:MAG: peptidoglycan DD-metalloendopeptidase family protein [Acidobacteriota bacterium]
MSRRLALLVALAAAAGAVASAAPPAPGDASLERMRGRLDQEIARLEAERDRLSRRERGVLGRLERLEAEARLLDARLERIRLDQRRTRAELERIAERQHTIEQRLAAVQRRLRATTRLLWRAGPLGRLRPVLSAADADRMVSAARLVHELSRRQREDVATVRQDLAALAMVRAQGEVQQARLDALRDEALEARTALRRAILARRALLESIRRDEAVRERALDELAEAKRRLEEMIAGLAEPAPVELDVRAFKGLLPMPVEGKVTRPFGDRVDPRFGTRLPHPGWDIAAPFGARVRPLFDGRVVFADWFRGYGLMVVVDHGHGVHSVYAHLSAILAPRGTMVDRETILGRVGDTGSLEGPMLYLEIRADGKAVDPAAWIRRDAS